MSEEMSKEVQDALNSMNEEIAQPDVNGQYTSSTTELQSSENKEANEVSARQPVVSIKKQLKVFEEINMQMGRFCQALKVVDAQFEQQAQVFYKAAEELGKKEKLSDEESIEFTVNIAAWATVKVFSKIYANIQKSKRLSDVKRILKQEADTRLDSVKQLKKWMPGILDSAYDRYNHVSDIEGITRCVSNLRESEYMNAVVLFLEATYEAALGGKFQDSYPYPSFAPINRHILYGLLCGKPELAQNEYLEGRRGCIEFLTAQTETVINENGTPSKELYVFASDSQVMAIAIHDINPMTDNDEVEFTDENQERLKSQDYYERFLQLFKVALSNQENIEAMAILNNEILIETVTHYLEIDKAITDSQSRLGTQICILGLIALLGFLGSWLIYGWTWYWCVVIGVVTAVITFIIMPISSVFEDRNDKLIRIEKTIQNESQKNGGEVKMINLAEMEQKTLSPWKLAVIGALVGIFFTPIGSAIGAVVGFLIGLFFGGNETEGDENYSYSHIKVGPSLFMRGIMYLLIAACIGVVVYYFIHNSDNKNAAHETVTELATPVEEVEVVEVATSLQDITENVDTVRSNTLERNITDDERLLRTVFEKFVFTGSDEDPHRYFNTKALCQLEDAYDYDAEGYGFWDLNIPLGEEDPMVDPSSSEYGVCEITSIDKEEDGWYKVFFKVSGIGGYNRLRVLNGKIEEYEPGRLL